MDSDLIFPIISVILLLVLSGFFSGSETAFTAASKARLLAREKEGNKRAGLVNKIREKKDRMIGALLLGNNLVNILASAIATSVLLKIFGESGVIWATIIMTILVLVFAEVLPKTYAFHNAETMAMRIAPILRLIIIIFAPITEAVTWIVRKVLKLFGIDISKVGAGSHLELLRGVIDMHDGKGSETQEQRAMLLSILDLADVDIEEIMVHRKNVAMINIDQPVNKIVEELLNSNFTRIPLWQNNPDNIVGIIHVKELLRELLGVGADINNINLSHIAMKPWFIPETTNLYDQLQAFRDRKEHFAHVVDEYGSFMGVVTLEDILEEIVGNIDDEHDESMQGVRRLSNGAFIVDGSVTIRDLNREFDWRLPDERYSTIAGLILFESQMVPDAGQSFRFHGFQMDVVRKRRNQITLIRVHPAG